MIDILNFNARFNEHKETILKLLFEHYGYAYSDLIKSRLENVIFDFSSLPEEEYKFVKMHGDQISTLNKILIKTRYRQYKKIQAESRKENIEALVERCWGRLAIKGLNKAIVKSETFLSLFTDMNFNSGYIDAFSSESIALLNNPGVSSSIKESIMNDQKEFYKNVKTLGISLDDLEPDIVDRIISDRKQVQRIYKKDIIEKTRYGKALLDAWGGMVNIFDVEATSEFISGLAFKEEPWAGWGTINDKDNKVVRCHYVKIPFFRLMNIGVRGLDVTLIHEIIHRIETCGYHFGLCVHRSENDNQIINEIRTQKLAIKITKQLHDLGVYIFDDPNNYTIEGECAYEYMFPMTIEFLEENDGILTYCAINNEADEMCDFFGECWDEFSERINNIYYDHMRLPGPLRRRGVEPDARILELIENMKTFRNGMKKNV